MEDAPIIYLYIMTHGLLPGNNDENNEFSPVIAELPTALQYVNKINKTPKGIDSIYRPSARVAAGQPDVVGETPRALIDMLRTENADKTLVGPALVKKIREMDIIAYDTANMARLDKQFVERNTHLASIAPSILALSYHLDQLYESVDTTTTRYYINKFSANAGGIHMTPTWIFS